MDPSDAQNHNRDSFAAQEGSQKKRAGYFGKPADEKVVQLVDLSEIRDRWGLGPWKVYRLVAEGVIRAYGRPGRQKYYSASEIEAWLSSSVIGRQLSWIELGDDILSA